jgi:SAM-dependent methyltransferase
MRARPRNYDSHMGSVRRLLADSRRTLELPGAYELDDAQLQLRNNDLRELHSPDRLQRVDYLIRLAHMRREIERAVTRNGVIVDVGCAQGNLATLLASNGFRVIATDLRSNFLRYARLKAVELSPSFLVCGGDALALQTRSADAIVLGELLEHVAHPQHFVAEAARILRPGGLLVASTPNGSHRWSPLPTYIEAKGHLGDFEPLQFGPDGGDHLFLYTADELDELLTRNGFGGVEVRCYYSDVTARVAARLRSLPGWSRTGTYLSPWMAVCLSRLDRLMLRILDPDRTAIGLIARAFRL